MTRFASDWNDTIDRRPQEVVVTFLACQSTTWLIAHQSLLAVGLQLPPDWAAGWLAARWTRKFRQPVNLALAAGLSRVFPVLGTFRMSPLVTGITANTADAEEWNRTRARLERRFPLTKPLMDALQSGAQWWQGPMDRYGMAFFLAGKATFGVAMMAAVAAIQRGVDLEASLTGWGFSTAVQGVAGTVAASSVANMVFVPLHFYLAVHGTRGMERLAQHWREESLRILAEWESPKEETSKEDQDDQGLKEEAVLRMMSWMLLLWGLGVSLYAIRLMGKKVVEENEASEEGPSKI